MQLASRSPYSKQGFGLIGLLVVLVVLGILFGIFSLVRALSGGHSLLSNGCKDTDITLQPVELSSLSAPLSVQAKLTMGSQSVPHEQITFRTTGQDSHGRTVGDLIGRAMTDANGLASYKNTTGFADQSITYGTGGVITGVEAAFDGNDLTDHVNDPAVPFYCGSKASVKLAQPLVVQQIGL